MVKYICFLLLLLGGWAHQSLAYSLRQVSNADGLSNSAVLSLLQDRDGFLWFGTCDGINIYDGMKVSLWNGFGKLDLSGYVIEDMLEMQDGVIWVQTNYGLIKADPRSHDVVTFPQFQGGYMMIKNNLDDLFVMAGDNSLYAFNKSKEVFYQLPVEGLKREDIVNMYVDERFLVVFSKSKIIYYQFERSDGGIYDISSVNTEDQVSVLYGFGDKKMIYWIDSQYNLYGHSFDRPVKSLMANWKEALEGRGAISSVLREGDTFFLAFQTNGLLKVTLQSGSQSMKVEDLGIRSGVFSLLRDRFQDVVWIATDGQGVYVYSDGQYSVQSVTYNDLNRNLGKPVRSIYLDDENTLWLGTKGEGILKIHGYDPSQYALNYRTELVTKQNSGLADNSVYAFARSSRPLFWIGHDEGLSYYSYIDRQIRTVSSSEKIRYVHAVYEESDSVLWLATVGTGIVRAVVQGKTVPVITRLKRYVLDKGTFSSNYFFTLHAGADHKLWFGNRGYGLFCLERDSLLAVPLSGEYVNKTVNDVFSVIQEEDTLWLGTSYGLLKKAGEDETCFNKRNGFASSTVHTMLQDRNKNIWIATNQGLICFNSRTGQFQNYNRLNGLDMQEFSDGASFSKDNVLYFGGVDGFAVVRENLIYHPQKYVSPLRLTELSVLGHEVNLTDYLEEEGGKSGLTLGCDQNYFSLSFTALDYIHPNNYVYQYRLNGSRGWINNEESNTIAFTQMKPGDYLLEVRYLNRATGELSRPYAMNISVLPPWYLTGTAVSAYVVLLLAGIAAALRMVWNRQQRKRKQALVRLEQEHKEELYEEKLRFFTNITHEFCTPLTLIYGPCERLLHYERSDAFVHKYVALIKSNAERLNALIQEVIDFRRLETGHQVLSVKPMNITTACGDIVSSFADLAEQNHINFEAEIDKGLLWNTDYSCLTKILNNLISNAFKYTPVGGTVRVSAAITEEDELCVSVYNTGKGIRKENIPLIFNRYKVLDNVEENAVKGLSARNGLGMAICHSMVELLGGKIRVESEVNQYAKFIVSLPRLEAVPGMPETSANGISGLSAGKADRPLVSGKLELPEDAVTDDDLSKPAILVVDDNKEILALLQEAFSGKFHVVPALNAEQALEKVKNHTPELIVTDVMMPGMDGVEFTRRLKKNQHTMSIPVIILSAKNSSEEKIAGLDAGADAYVGKPFDVSYLKAIAERLVENREKMKAYYNSSACAYDFSHGQLLKAEDKDFVCKMTSYIDANISREDLSQEELADYLQISTRTLYRRLKDMGMGSPKDYIKECRINLATRLLKTTSLTIQEIMFKAGFSNRSHFYKEFAKRFQMTPKDYRESQKNKDEQLE